MSFIAIDLGTSFIKGAVLDLEAQRLKHIRRIPFPDALPGQSPLMREYEPNRIVSSVKNLLSELALHAPDCVGVVMCAQMHGMALLNERGEILSNYFSWYDQRALMPHPSRAGSYFDVLAQRIDDKHRRQLGNELRPGLPVCLLFWLAEQRRLAPGLIPVSIADFVLSVLCGPEPGVDTTNAAAYGLLNLETLQWHYEVIETLGLDRLRWPTVRKHGEVVGYLTLGSRLVPCYTPVGDYQCALAGALLSSEELSLNISTGSQISRLAPDLIYGDYQTRPFFDGKFLNTFTHVPAGRSLNLLVDLLSEIATAQGIALEDPWVYIARAAAAISETDLQVDLTFHTGPYGDRGRIANIRGENLTVGHLFRAAFQTMADTYYALALRLWPERSWRNLVFSGGLAWKLGVLRQVIREKFQTDYRLPPTVEDTLLGLLVLAWVFSGRAESVEQAMNDLRSRPPGWCAEESSPTGL